MAVVVINPVPKAFKIVAKRFIFLANFPIFVMSPKHGTQGGLFSLVKELADLHLVLMVP